MPPKKEPTKSRTKTSSQYVDDIKERHAEAQADPSNVEKQKKLDYSVSAWEKTLKKTVIRANNEGNPWSEKELGMPIRDMPTKRESGEYQTADYMGYYESPGCSGYVGVLVERKGGDIKKGGPPDLYQSLMVKENCERFYREIDRFQKDKRFSQLVLIAECSFEQFLLYCPPFIGKSRNTDHIGASVEARRGKIASLYARGVNVIFAGTRYNAIETYKALIRQWIIKNYVSILKLDAPLSDASFLKDRLARLEIEIKATRQALGVEV